MVLVGGLVVLALAAVAFPRRSTEPLETGSEPQTDQQNQPADAAPTPPTASQARVPKPARATSQALTPRTVREPAKKPVPTPRAAGPAQSARATENYAATRPAVSDPAAAPARESSAAVGIAAAPVTITGCLEISTDDEQFRLTETEGAEALKSRSWRTGFLKKRSPPIALVEPPDRLAMRALVGKRVAATGLLASRELKVRSLRLVGTGCN